MSPDVTSSDSHQAAGSPTVAPVVVGTPPPLPPCNTPQNLFGDAASGTALPSSLLESFARLHPAEDATPADSAGPFTVTSTGLPSSSSGLFNQPSILDPMTSHEDLPIWANSSANGELRTIFVSGFHPAACGSELHKLLTFAEGYQASQMTWSTGVPQGFALFSTAAQAHAAVEVLSGLQVDDGITLRAEMAHKNMYIRPGDHRIKHARRYNTSMLDTITQLPPVPQLTAATLAASSAAPLTPAAPAFLAAAAAAAAAAASRADVLSLPGLMAPMPTVTAGFNSGQVLMNLRDNPPCNTLFIGNLSDHIEEQELLELMSNQPGFSQFKLVKAHKGVTAFVEFTSVAAAVDVHARLQGTVLASSKERGPIRIQFSKNPFGRRDSGSSAQSSGLPSPGLAVGPPLLLSTFEDPLAGNLTVTLGNSHSSPPGLGTNGVLGTMTGGFLTGGASNMMTQAMLAPAFNLGQGLGILPV